MTAFFKVRSNRTPFQSVADNYGGLQALFGLSLLDYCRKMVVLHDRPFLGNINTTILSLRSLKTYEHEHYNNNTFYLYPHVRHVLASIYN